jgi:bacteriocin-like protein
MEKTMSKTMPRLPLDLGSAATFTVRELRDDELQEVSGGASSDPTMSDFISAHCSARQMFA